MKKHYYSVFDNEQDCLKAILDLHIKQKTFEADLMFYKGGFYKTIEKPSFISDLNPKFDYVKKIDATNTGIVDNNFNSIILDPPFMFGLHGKTKNYTGSNFGIYKNFEELEFSYKSLLKESYRILKKKGILIFKCQDYTDAKTTLIHCLVYKWATELSFYSKDLVILNNTRNKVTNNSLNQRHFRKTHTYFFVFQKK